MPGHGGTGAGDSCTLCGQSMSTWMLCMVSPRHYLLSFPHQTPAAALGLSEMKDKPSCPFLNSHYK